MGKGLHRSLQIYLSKLRSLPTADPSQDSNNTTATTSWFLSACKYPKTPSFAADRHHPRRHPPGHDGGCHGSHAATLSDVDRFLFENFNSLYTTRDDDDDPVDAAAAAALEDYLADDCECSSPPRRHLDPPPDVRASRRFFVSPGTSNSLLEGTRPSAGSSTSSSSASPSTSSSTATVTQPPPAVPGGVVAVTTFSKDPYEDFRRSMQEMAEARHVDPREPLDWDFMEELLICYLELNDRSVHRHVIRAFTHFAIAAPRRAPRRAPVGGGGGGGRGRRRNVIE